MCARSRWDHLSSRWWMRCSSTDRTVSSRRSSDKQGFGARSRGDQTGKVGRNAARPCRAAQPVDPACNRRTSQFYDRFLAGSKPAWTNDTAEEKVTDARPASEGGTGRS